jgi:hypothetical protein
VSKQMISAITDAVMEKWPTGRVGRWIRAGF